MTGHRISVGLVLLLVAFGWSAASAAQWEPLPLWGGEAQVAAAQGDSSVVYAASPTAGLYQSIDGGATWSFVAAGPNRLEILILGVDPHDPRHIFMAAIDPGSHDSYAGLFRSEDGGAHWQRIDQGLFAALDVAFDPETPGRLYAATNRGLYRSDDLGSTWDRIAFADEMMLRVAAAPGDPRVVLALRQSVDRSETIVRSSDGGETFAEVLDSPALQFVFDPAHPGRVFEIDHDGVLYRSDDLGATWTRLPRASAALSSLAITRTGTLLAGSSSARGVARSTDGGVTWESLPGLPGARPPSTVSSFVVRDDGVLAGGFRGIWRSLTDGQGWRESATGLRVQSILSVEVAGDAASTVWVGSMGGFFSSRNEGASFQRRQAALGIYDFLRLLAVHPRRPQIAYAYGCCAPQVPALGMLKTEDAGRSWRRLPYPGVLFNMTVITVDPSNPAVVYAGGTRDDGICSALRSTDGGATWSCISPVRPSDLFSLVIDPRDPKVLYGLFDGRLYRSANRGTSWKPVPARGDVRLFGFLALDPNRRDRLYAFSGGARGVSRSEDGGRTWVAATNGLPATGYPSDLLVDPSRPGRVWVALRLFSQIGEELTSRIFRSDDAGRHWTEASAGLEPGAFVTELAVDPREGGVLYAGTAGQGLYRLRVEE